MGRSRGLNDPTEGVFGNVWLTRWGGGLGSDTDGGRGALAPFPGSRGRN